MTAAGGGTRLTGRQIVGKSGLLYQPRLHGEPAYAEECPRTGRRGMQADRVDGAKCT